MEFDYDDNDGRNDGAYKTWSLRQLYAAIIFRALADIACADNRRSDWDSGNAEIKPSEPKRTRRIYVRHKQDEVDCPISRADPDISAMAWIFNGDKLKNKSVVPLSYACEVLGLEPEQVQKFAAKLVTNKKNGITWDKTEDADKSPVTALAILRSIS